MHVRQHRLHPQLPTGIGSIHLCIWLDIDLGTDYLHVVIQLKYPYISYHQVHTMRYYVQEHVDFFLKRGTAYTRWLVFTQPQLYSTNSHM